MARFKCTNPECERFDVPIEASIDEATGKLTMDLNIIKTCPICKGARIYDEKTNPQNTCSWNIDHSNLNSKRMYETKVRKYKGYD